MRTGLFTSPHFIRYNERIRRRGREVDDAALVAAFERIEAARGTTTLTFFEYNTLAALLIFAARPVDVAVLEVGLGGRLDATNLLDADVAVLASVGFDHRDWLGDTLEQIGAEKAGIFRAGRPAVLGTPEMPASVFAALGRLEAQAVVAERDFSWRTRGARWDYDGLGVTLHDLPAPALAGAIQYRNAATAIAAMQSLGARARRARRGSRARPASRRRSMRHVVSGALAQVRLAGRFQIVPGAVEWILDIAHNEPAAQVLAAQLAARPPPGGAGARTFAVIGVLADKDAAGHRRCAGTGHRPLDHVRAAGPRGSSGAQLAERLARPAATVQLAASVTEGCALAQAARRRRRPRPGVRLGLHRGPGARVASDILIARAGCAACVRGPLPRLAFAVSPPFWSGPGERTADGRHHPRGPDRVAGARAVDRSGPVRAAGRDRSRLRRVRHYAPTPSISPTTRPRAAPPPRRSRPGAAGTAERAGGGAERPARERGTFRHDLRGPRPRSPPAAHAAGSASAPPAATAPRPARVPSSAPARQASAAPAPGSGGAEQWVVQLGSFASRANAEHLAQQVRAGGFQASVSQAATGRKLYRVRVGPVRDRAAAGTSRHGCGRPAIRAR